MMRCRFPAAVICLFGFVNGPAAAADSVAIAPGSAFGQARQPQVAVGPDAKVRVTFGVGNAICCAPSEDAGKHFSAPVLVGESGVMSLGMRRGPQIAATAKAVVIAAI